MASCPEIITRTWQGVDDCGYHDQCSQTVTVVDTTPPTLNCTCLTNPAISPLVLTVTNCTANIPDICKIAPACAFDRCGLSGCVQSPAAGTPVGVGIHPVTVTVYDCASNTASCLVNFTVITPAGGCGTNPCVPPPSGMAAWWPLDETCGAAAFADITGNGNAAIVESGGPVCSGGSPNAVPGNVAGANYFYMPSVRGRVPSPTALNVASGSFGLDCWVNPVFTGPVHWHPIVDKLQQTGPATGFGYKVGLLNTQVVLIVGDGTLATYTSVGSITYSVWNFVGVSVDRTANTVTFHVNGVTEPAQTLAPAASFNSPVNFLIGSTYALNSPYGELAIDELEFFRRALAHADFSSIWQANAAGKCKPQQPCTNSVVTIFCPPNTNVVTCSSNAVVSFTPVASTSCGTIISLVSTPPSGSVFPLGTTTVTCTATDSQGQTASCTFTVTVLGDTTPPTLDCNCLTNPAVNPVLVPLTVYACQATIPDLCAAASICASDNCGPPVCSQSPVAGTSVGPGTHPIIVTVTDASSNSASCLVIFTVIAPTQTNVWNTGMGGPSGNIALAPGTPDPNFQLISAPPGGCNGPTQVLQPGSLPGVWLANGPNSQWVGAGPTASCQAGVYHYRLCFNLTCTDGAAIIGQWTADDYSEILLNGQPTGHILPSTQYPYTFSGWHPVAITNGFVCGQNCLDIYVTNAYTFDNPTGFRAELTNTFNDCCCTPTQTLFSVKSGVGAAGPLPLGSLDPNLTLTCVPPGINVTIPVVTQPSPFWMPNGPNSQWVGPFPQLGNAPDGVYCYTLNFTIPCPTNVPIRASVTGQWTADDTGTIYLNGVPTTNTLPNGWAFTNWQTINFTSGFVPGLNTLTFYVTNGIGSPSPTGIRLELTGAASCCPCDSTNCFVTITCPTNLDLEICGTNTLVNYPTPSASSTCAAITNIVCTPPPLSLFPLGTNTVVCTAYDALGHSNSCSFLIIVRPDRTPPNCPPLQMTVTGCPPLMPNFATNGLITDNCTPTSLITVSQSIPPGTPLTSSPTVVILNVCDAAGNCRVCDVSITPAFTPGCCTNLVPVLRLFSGATNNTPGLLPGGALDTHFLTGPPLFSTPSPYVPWVINGWWLPNSASSKWVGPTANYGYGAAGAYYYTNRFFLCSTNQATLTGRWTADDNGRIWLNGNPTANVLPPGWGFTNWHPVSIASGFVPGWNTLVFAVTNGGGPTGLRTEIQGRACCNNCVAIACPPDIITNTCAGGVPITYLPIGAASSCGNIVSVTATPPSGSVFPVGTTVVTCTAIDSQGNAATCNFTVTVQRIGKPVAIKCPPDQIRYTCGSNAVAYYHAVRERAGGAHRLPASVREHVPARHQYCHLHRHQCLW